MRGFVTLNVDDSIGLMNDVGGGPITFPVERFASVEHGGDGAGLVTIDRPTRKFWVKESASRVIALVAKAKV